MTKIIKIRLILSTIFILTALWSGAAWALTASNTRIVNNATLSYNDGSAPRTATASVTVIVALVPAAPAVTPGPDQTTGYTGPATLLTNSFTVTATANGPDSYDIVANITGSSNTTAPTATPQSASINLGATVTMTGSTTTALVVPSDGTSDGAVNGIQAGSTVVVSSEARTVGSVTDNASGTSTITLAAALSAAPGPGILVAEQESVLVDVTAGTITTAGTDITVTKNITITSATDPGESVTSGTVTDTYTSGLATLDKYVRNVTTPAAGSGTAYSYNTNSYYPAGVTARPGEILEYILVVTNSGTGPVTASVVNDVLPTGYVALTGNAYGAGGEVTYVSDTNAVSIYSAASDADQATYSAGTLTVNLGSGASNTTGGSIPGGNSRVLVLYQVTVNP